MRRIVVGRDGRLREYEVSDWLTPEGGAICLSLAQKGQGRTSLFGAGAVQQTRDKETSALIL